MAHINDLPDKVLELILYYAVATLEKTLSEWKAKLPLVAVCRTWTKLAIPTVFYQVYVEVEALHSNTRPSWTSNAGFLISRGCILAARRLTIEFADRVTPECLHSIALKILQLDRVDWQHVNTLTVTGPSSVHEYYQHIPGTVEASEADIARAMQYFGRNLRNVTELNLAYSNGGSSGECICFSLAKVYSGQLQIHRVSKYNLFGFVNFSRNIKVLELRLDSSAAHVLPSICGETLRVLRLYNAPRNFAWHHFRYNIFVRPIVFHQLTIFHLSYLREDKDQALTEDEIQDKVASGAHNCDQLSFPALKQLSIAYCTPDCDLLYADLPFPKLEKVKLAGYINNIRYCSRLKLTWIRDLHVEIFPCSFGNAAGINRATNHLFTNIGIGRSASLLVFADEFILDTDVLRWTNLTKLFIRRVNYATACKAIGRLPNLCELIIHNLQFGDMATNSLTADSSLFLNADPMLTWGEKLAILSVSIFEGDCPLAGCMDGIQDLILHAGALKDLGVPGPTKQLVAAFIDVYKDRYPHLANMQLDVAKPFLGHLN
ncbi:hypothetical protein GGH94_003804 [Coemansia aciculifera]|uniref:F-box domain-containing protein n=1 Tax=Coemansia aciculifera TaxID=417176 RepID=A0A9W8IGP2_9FUNG|nr:hypothetical protein GGH94_003804 [Coemansia aciculifera]